MPHSSQRRRHSRMEVNLPIVCNIIDSKNQLEISSKGKVFNLSLSGMKISLPVNLSEIKPKIVDFFLKLPDPFQKISGNGHIRWVYWDENIQQTTIGMELGPLDSLHQTDIEAILNELSNDILGDQ
jgi:c-di-GMP-binding flagellar brake protein YcgR